jgi:enterochelin esterase-like enzyme
MIFTSHTVNGGHLAAPRQVSYFPATAGEAKNCLLFLDGELYTDRVKAPALLSEAQAAGMLLPVACVYLPNVSAADYTCNEAFASFIAEEMPRWIEREIAPFERLFLCGLSLSALQAVFTALRHPGVFAGVLAQSPSAWWEDESLTNSLPIMPSPPQRMWMSVGTQELQTNVSHPPTPLLQKASQLDSVLRLSSTLGASGHDIHSHEYNGGHDPACWAAELTQSLAWLMQRLDARQP